LLLRRKMLPGEDLGVFQVLSGYLGRSATGHGWVHRSRGRPGRLVRRRAAVKAGRRPPAGLGLDGGVTCVFSELDHGNRPPPGGPTCNVDSTGTEPSTPAAEHTFEKSHPRKTRKDQI